MFSMESFHRRYPTEPKALRIGGRRFSFFVPRDLEPFMDPGDMMKDFPLWAKIWEASIVLADYMAALPPDSRREILEIGCGVGVVGTVASAFGHRVTMTEYNRDALRFAEANTRNNPASKGGRVEVLHLDWNRPALTGPYDIVIGSEVIYKKKDFRPILRLLQACLKPDGTVILAEGLRQTSVAFFSEAGALFDIRAHKKTIRLADRTVRVILAVMTFKTPP